LLLFIIFIIHIIYYSYYLLFILFIIDIIYWNYNIVTLLFSVIYDVLINKIYTFTMLNKKSYLIHTQNVRKHQIFNLNKYCIKQDNYDIKILVKILQ
jgi:hypothetical protein